MLITFRMVNKETSTEFKVFGKKYNDVISFADKLNKDTMIHLHIFSDKVIIEKSGNIKMYQEFILNKQVCGTYETYDGFSFNIASYTKKMEVNEHYVHIEYDYYLDEECQSSNKIEILF